MADNDVTSRLILEGDSKGAEKAIADVKKQFMTAQKEAGRLTEIMKNAGKEGAKGFQQTNLEIANGYKETLKLKQALVDATEAKKQFGREQLGDISTSLGSLGSVAGAAGGGAGVEALRFGGDVAGALEYSGRFKQAILDAGEAATASKGLIGDLAAGFIEADFTISNTTAGLKALAVVGVAVAGVTVAIAAVVGAISTLSNALDESRKVAEAYATEERNRARLRAEADQLLAENNFSAVEERLKANQAEVALLQAERKKLEELRDQAQNEYDSSGDAIQRALIAKEIDEYNRQLGELGVTIGNTAEDSLALSNALNSTAGQTAKTAEAFNKATDEFVAKEQERVKLEEQTTKVIASLNEQEAQLIANLEKRRAEQDADLARAQARAAEDKKLDVGREKRDAEIAAAREEILLNEQLEREAEQHAKNIADITKRGNDAIAQAYKDLASKQADAAKQIADIEKQFAADAIKAEREFTKERTRAQEDFAKSVKRLKEDLAESKLDAVAENDVDAFLRAERDTDKTIKRNREDFRTDKGRGREDFEEARAEAEAAKAQRIADIQEELAAYQLATLDKIAQIEAQKQADILAAQEAFDSKLALDAAERERQKQWEGEDRAQRLLDDIEDRNIKNQRDADDRALVRGREDAALQEQLDRIAQQRDAQVGALGAVSAAVERLRQQALALAYGGSSSSGKSSIPKFAGGAEKITRGGLAIVDPLETIIPAAQAEPYRRNRTGQSTVIDFKPTFNTVNFGGEEYIKRSELEGAMNKLAQATEKAFEAIV